MRTKDRIAVVCAATAASLIVGLVASAQNLDVKGTTNAEGGLFVGPSTSPSAVLFSGTTAVNGGAGAGGVSFSGRPRMGDWGQWLTVGEPNGGIIIQVSTKVATGSSPSLTAAPTLRNVLDDGSGNVGLGTLSPSQRLHVAGAGLFQANGSFLYGMDGGGSYRFAVNNDSGPNLNFYGNDGSWFTFMTVNNAGARTVTFNTGVSMGTTASCCAGSNPTLSLAEATSSNGRLPWLQFHASGYQEGFIRLARDLRTLEFGDDQGWGMAIALLNGSGTRTVNIDPRGNSTWFNGGNVGIGTTAPAATLHVNGNIRIGGTMEIVEKGGDNGTATCAQFCFGSQWAGWSGSCVAAFNSDTGQPTPCTSYNGTNGLSCLCARFASGVVSLPQPSGGSCPSGYINCGGTCAKSPAVCP
ncbi:MAG TPA: hypothetical protein VFF06_19480 [Polyangia bacterium]|nr:hypothetical protein [Polyangia bacterium]